MCITLIEKPSKHTTILNRILEDAPHENSAAAYMLLKREYAVQDTERRWKHDWRYYFIARRTFLRRKRRDRGGFWVCHYCGKVIEKMEHINTRNKQRNAHILAKRKTTRLYRILDHIRHNAYSGLTYGEIQKFIYEDIYKGKKYDPVKNRGTYGSNLQYVILPIYCVRTSDGKRWRLKPYIWTKKVLDASKPLWKN